MNQNYRVPIPKFSRITLALKILFICFFWLAPSLFTKNNLQSDSLWFWYLLTSIVTLMLTFDTLVAYLYNFKPKNLKYLNPYSIFTLFVIIPTFIILISLFQILLYKDPLASISPVIIVLLPITLMGLIPFIRYISNLSRIFLKSANRKKVGVVKEVHLSKLPLNFSIKNTLTPIRITAELEDKIYYLNDIWDPNYYKYVSDFPGKKESIKGKNVDIYFDKNFKRYFVDHESIILESPH